MEPVIHGSVNLPSTKYTDSSDDEDIFLKRNPIKTRLFDSDDENLENISEVAHEKNSESDTEEKTSERPHTSAEFFKRNVKEGGSDSDGEGNSYNLSNVVNTSILSNEVLDYTKGVAYSGESNSSERSTNKVLSDSLEYKRKSLFSQSDIFDAEDSDDDIPFRSMEHEDSPATVGEHTVREKSKAKKFKEKKVSKPNHSKEDLQKIHSESQRMVRESRVSLPYHRPRQRTLAEFLNRRENVLLPVKSLKTSPTKLGVVWQTLEKKVKEAEEFYKSDSDSELDEGDQGKGGGDQVMKKEDGEGNKLENNEETPPSSSEGVANDQVVDVTVLEEASSCLMQNVPDGPEEKDAEGELTKIMVDEASSDEKLGSAVSSVGCDSSAVGLFTTGESTKGVNNAVPESTEVSDAQSDSKRAESNEETGNHRKESDLGTSSMQHSHDTEDKSEIPSILNNIPDAVIKDQTNSESNGCLDSCSEKTASSTVCSNDFSNLFPKAERQKSDGIFPLVDSDSVTMTSDEHGNEPLISIDKLHVSENSIGFSQTGKKTSNVKIPSPPPLEDSESISLRLDDDTVDESGPNPECSHACTLPQLPENAANPESQTLEDDAPRVSTPVKMLMELEVGNNDSAEDNAPGVMQQQKTSLLHISNASPIQLEGDPDIVIDLDEDVRTKPTKEVGVQDLMRRFIKHHIPKKVVCEEKKVNIGIEIVEGGGDKGPEKVKQEVMTVTLGGNDPIKNASPGTERPGARLRSLREELQREIARKRDKEWAKRQQEYSLDEEGVKEGEEKFNLDDDEEEELTDSSSSEEEEEEEELEENDVDMSTKSRPRSEYVDDEAEESDEEDIDGGKEDSNEGSALEDVEGDEEEEEKNLIKENECADKIKESKEVSSDVKDSPAKVEGGSKDGSPTSSKKRKFQRFKTFDLFDSEDDGDVNDYNSASDMTSPPSTPFMQNRNGAQGRLSLPSPALPLTALQRCTNSPTIGQNSPWAFTQKGLFDDEESPKQSKDENDSLKGKSALINLVGQSQGSEVAEDELLNLMSGAFLSRANKISEAEDDFSLTLEDTQELFDKSQSKEKIKEEDTIEEKSSQKDVKDFGNSHWSRLNFSFNDENDKDNEKETASDDDLEEIKKRKKLRQLDISDDEDDEQNLMGDKLKISQGEEDDEDGAENDRPVSDKESSNESGEEEESDLDEEVDEERVVEYDSEENAIVVEERVVKKVRGPRRGLEFLEAEAELSEGEEEWAGSGDEDEHGLDRMEKEEGDADKLDDEMVRRELGRIHMRQMLDEDKRDVRVLQEIFLEDGELHADGQGRERKFRWRNIDNMDDSDFRPMDSGDEDKVEDEDETEEKWRRLRHERETWLREHQQNSKIGDSESLLNEIEEDSQILKLGRAALRRTNSFPNNALTKWLKTAEESKDKASDTNKPHEKEPESPDLKRSFKMLCKRGSFLARKDGTLERLAEMAIKSSGAIETECLTSTSPVVAKTKNSHKFVFTVLSPEKKDPKAIMEPPKEASLPVRKCTKRKKRELKHTEAISKKSKRGTEASIFQFL